MSTRKAVITGVGGYVPKDVLSNHDIEKMVDTSDEWIVTRTGIKERRILRGKDQGTSVMGTEAAKEVLRKTDTDPAEVELIICATTTPDMIFPATANLIADKIGAINSFGYDLQAACSGFLYALTTATQFIEAGKYQKVLVVGADKMSSIINYEDRATCIIFGDGAGAVMLEATEEPYGVIDSILRSDGSGAQHLHLKAGGSRRPATIETVMAKEHFVYQEGGAVFKYAVKHMANVAATIMERNQLSSENVAWLVPHQANKRIIDATANRMGLDQERVMYTIHKYGNTTSATIPLNLWEYESQLKQGDNLVLAAFGGGFTWGATYLKWGYNGS
ncbi:beta-ketoacyl-ACP synthase III [Tunicatimonas pelagia]|uniref:beta-ketoacyl-ACP synthase III n=1 Tax=Tunicatimonas pelagia TaxID=931531 RepID=UPI0026650F62|nr:beta-ketoacyl-ACP synthase III [Tunicatimonas pelagia]WKN46291.1 ketoacyl-ACP synthase III [Tunicatimonas pelagia]